MEIELNEILLNSHNRNMKERIIIGTYTSISKTSEMG